MAVGASLALAAYLVHYRLCDRSLANSVLSGTRYIVD